MKSICSTSLVLAMLFNAVRISESLTQHSVDQVDNVKAAVLVKSTLSNVAQCYSS